MITASEDGNLSIVDYLNNQLLHQQKYNENAKRGINDIAIAGNFLLLSNCSVGPYDKNLWLYKVKNNTFTYLDSINLVADKSKSQVFSFSVGLITGEQNDYFMCSTGESLLWYGIIKDDRFGKFCFAENSLKGGAALPHKNTACPLIMM